MVKLISKIAHRRISRLRLSTRAMGSIKLQKIIILIDSEIIIIIIISRPSKRAHRTTMVECSSKIRINLSTCTKNRRFQPRQLPIKGQVGSNPAYFTKDICSSSYQRRRERRWTPTWVRLRTSTSACIKRRSSSGTKLTLRLIRYSIRIGLAIRGSSLRNRRSLSSYASRTSRRCFLSNPRSLRRVVRWSSSNRRLVGLCRRISSKLRNLSRRMRRNYSLVLDNCTSRSWAHCQIIISNKQDRVLRRLRQSMVRIWVWNLKGAIRTVVAQTWWNNMWSDMDRLWSSSNLMMWQLRPNSNKTMPIWNLSLTIFQLSPTSEIRSKRMISDRAESSIWTKVGVFNRVRE